MCVLLLTVLLVTCPEALVSAEYRMCWFAFLLCGITEAYVEGCKGSVWYTTSVIKRCLYRSNLVVSGTWEWFRPSPSQTGPNLHLKLKKPGCN